MNHCHASLTLLSGQINWSRGSNETGLLCSYPRGKASIYSHLHQYVSPLYCHSLMLHKASFQSLLVEVMVKEMPSSSGIWRSKLFFLDIFKISNRLYSLLSEEPCCWRLRMIKLFKELLDQNWTTLKQKENSIIFQSKPLFTVQSPTKHLLSENYSSMALTLQGYTMWPNSVLD